MILITNAPRPAAEVQAPARPHGRAATCLRRHRHVRRPDARVIAARAGQDGLSHRAGARSAAVRGSRRAIRRRTRPRTTSSAPGLFNDEGETPEDYRAMFEKSRARNMFMLCANPDLVVERGTQLIYCAGALADLYHSMGGEVLYAGKPHPPIYQEALRRAAAARGSRRAASARHRDRRFNPHRHERRGAVRHRQHLRDRRHSRRGTRRARMRRIPACSQTMLAREGVSPTAVMRQAGRGRAALRPRQRPLAIRLMQHLRVERLRNRRAWRSAIARFGLDLLVSNRNGVAARRGLARISRSSSPPLIGFIVSSEITRP